MKPASNIQECFCSWPFRVYRQSAETLWRWDDHALTAAAALMMMTMMTTCCWWRHTTSRRRSNVRQVAPAVSPLILSDVTVSDTNVSINHCVPHGETIRGQRVHVNW